MSLIKKVGKDISKLLKEEFDISGRGETRPSRFAGLETNPNIQHVSDQDQDPYEVLGLDPGASQEEIEKAYRRLSMELHPDHNPSPDASEKFQAIKKAHDQLSDPAVKQRHDFSLAKKRNDTEISKKAAQSFYSITPRSPEFLTNPNFRELAAKAFSGPDGWMQKMIYLSKTKMLPQGVKVLNFGTPDLTGKLASASANESAEYLESLLVEDREVISPRDETRGTYNLPVSKAIERLKEKFELSPKKVAFLWGGPGVGKSALVETVAEQMGVDVIVVITSLFNPEDIMGLPDKVVKNEVSLEVDPENPNNMIKKDIESTRTGWLIPQIWPSTSYNSLGNNNGGIIFFDELNTAKSATLNPLMNLMLTHKLPGYDMPDAWRLWAAGNRNSENPSVTQFSAPMARRLDQMTIEPDRKGWEKYSTEKKEVPGYIMDFLEFRPELFHHLVTKDGALPEIGNFPNPASWSRLGKDLIALQNKYSKLPLKEFLEKLKLVAAENVGVNAAEELAAYVGLKAIYPADTIKKIMYEPDKAKLPPQVGEQLEGEKDLMDDIFQGNQEAQKEFNDAGQKKTTRIKDKANYRLDTMHAIISALCEHCKGANLTPEVLINVSKYAGRIQAAEHAARMISGVVAASTDFAHKQFTLDAKMKAEFPDVFAPFAVGTKVYGGHFLNAMAHVFNDAYHTQLNIDLSRISDSNQKAVKDIKQKDFKVTTSNPIVQGLQNAAQEDEAPEQAEESVSAEKIQISEWIDMHNRMNIKS